ATVTGVVGVTLGATVTGVVGVTLGATVTGVAGVTLGATVTGVAGVTLGATVTGVVGVTLGATVTGVVVGALILAGNTVCCGTVTGVIFTGAVALPGRVTPLRDPTGTGPARTKSAHINPKQQLHTEVAANKLNRFITPHTTTETDHYTGLYV
uniref:hypothetical protein n=1 Tax=Umezakia ovalisporum TaxID=75695 RepID=UPI0039C5E34A